MTQTLGIIADGIYPGISDAEYRSSLVWSSRMTPSVLEYGVQQTMAHVKAAYDGKVEFDTDSLSFGRAFHCRLLEPERFKTAFGVAQQCQADTAKKMRCSKRATVRVAGQWLCSTHADGDGSEIEVITEDEASTIEAMRARVFKHPAVNILKASGGCEVAIAWTDPRTRTPMKSKLDKWMQKVHGVDYSMILDLKTIRSAHPRAISNAIEEYGWARAAALRCDGIEALTGQRPRYCLICIEKEHPHEVCVPMIGEETMRGARWEVRNLLALWSKCVKDGAFPGYGDDFLDIEAPDWKLKVYENLVPHNGD